MRIGDPIIVFSGNYYVTGNKLAYPSLLHANAKSYVYTYGFITLIPRYPFSLSNSSEVLISAKFHLADYYSLPSIYLSGICIHYELETALPVKTHLKTTFFAF